MSDISEEEKKLVDAISKGKTEEAKESLRKILKAKTKKRSLEVLS